MREPNLVAQARQGDIKALADLLNQELLPQGVTAKTTLTRGILKIVLESAEVLEQKTMVAFIYSEITKLEIEIFPEFQVCSLQKNAHKFTWKQEFNLEASTDLINIINPDFPETPEIYNINKNQKKIEARYLYLDLEVDRDGKIYQMGLSSQNINLNIDRDNLNSAYQQLANFKQTGLSICGHNFRRFDYPHLLKANPEFDNWLIIDTLELAILAFPLEETHKLNKKYKQSDYAINNPLEDAIATRELLEDIIAELKQKPTILQQI
ncbi:MAG: RecQ family ATP-dependent DNA helicase, partial [Microcoleaceae cyanobacterium]